ncbi:putative membrane protein [Acetoanaerobium pronyense]|uniref:Membrane protein n=1 Tax=Acetoanaerobium pronyense TaxID=1482736 RepID=A0ABS4KIB3_9FIRM|nr:DUF2254 domain-containing protein [Acetoanaerobium pronyense]MBP2027500.1 putative membrane protein [Acetoanaerobium pronyense]
MRLMRWLLKLRKSIWVYPIFYSITSLILSIFIITLDSRWILDIENYMPEIFFTSVDLAETVLATIAGALLSMTIFTFSTTMVVLTMYSSQFSPRTVENFLTNKITMQILGVFMGGFVYSIFSLLFMRQSLSEMMVISATIGVIYAIICLVYFAVFVHHVGNYIQASNLIQRLNESSFEKVSEYKNMVNKWGITRELDIYEYGVVLSITSKENGYIQLIDYEGIYEVAQETKSTIILEKVIGQFITDDTQIMSIHVKEISKFEEKNINQVLSFITIGSEKTDLQDFNFSIQKIVEIALRAISPGINDPNTANHCILMLGVILGKLSDLEKGYLVFEDDNKEGRAIFEAIDFNKELYFTFYQIIYYGNGDISVVLSILKSLRFVMEKASKENRVITLKFVNYIMDKIEPNLRKGIDYEMIKSEREEIYSIFSKRG